MTVQQLIEELQKLPPDTEVFTYDNEWSEYDVVESVKVQVLSRKMVHTKFLVGYKYQHWNSLYPDQKGEQIEGVVLQ